MKKQWSVIAIAGLLISQSVAASEGDDFLYEVRSKEWKGMGAGSIVGAIVAGPPGLILGAAGGALIGRTHGLAEGVNEVRKEVSALNRELEESRAQHLQLNQLLNQAKMQRRGQLEAIVSGMVLNIQFRTESASLEPYLQHQLKRLARSMSAFPELFIHVDAFADQRGGNAFNLGLSAKRAEVVSRYLQAEGIKAFRIQKIPHGEEGSKYSPADTEGLGYDRRVLIRFCLEGTS
ncbi:MAG: OmpA family protein [Candidatus Sedimenticola sp. 6PFRAG7]